MNNPERALAHNEEAQLQGQLSVSEKAFRLKVALKKKEAARLEEAEEELSLENQYLRENTAKASMALEERERMQSALEGAEDAPAKQRAKAFRNIVTNQKLLDISRSQMAEVQFLRAEVERLKARSYPSFATPPRPVTVGPDSRGVEGPRWWPAPGAPPHPYRPPTRGATAPASGGRLGTLSLEASPPSSRRLRSLGRD